MLSTRGAEIALGGKVFKTKGAGDLFVIKSDEKGGVRWAFQIDSEGLEESGTIAVSPSGVIHFGANRTNQTEPGALFSCFYGQIGAEGGLQLLEDPWNKNGNCAIRKIAVGLDGRVFLTGQFSGGASSSRKNGNPIYSFDGKLDHFIEFRAPPEKPGPSWSLVAGTIADDVNPIHSIALAKDNVVYWAANVGPGKLFFSEGLVLEGPSEGNAFVAKVNSLGEQLWARRLSGGVSSSCSITAMTAGTMGLLVAGHYSGAISLGTQNSFHLGSFESQHLFQGVLGSDGSWNNARSLGQNGAVYGGERILLTGASLFWAGSYQARDLSLGGRSLPRSDKYRQGWVWKMPLWP